MEENASGLGLQDGSAHGSNGSSINMAHWEKALQWFTDFESWQDKRFADMAGMFQECKDIFEVYKFIEFDNLTDEMETLKKWLEETEIKLDEIENHSGRNNVVVFNLPEGEEEGDCQKFFGKLLGTVMFVVLCSLLGHNGPGANRKKKMAPGPFLLKRTGGHFFRTGSHSQILRKCNFFKTSYSYWFSISIIGGFISSRSK